MVGLNHEMARQLLWNGYPTDQRGQLLPAVLGRQRLRAAARRPDRPGRSSPSCSRTSRRSTPGRCRAARRSTRTGPTSCRQRRAAGARRAAAPLPERDHLRRPRPSCDGGDTRMHRRPTDERLSDLPRHAAADMTFLGFNLSPSTTPRAARPPRRRASSSSSSSSRPSRGSGSSRRPPAPVTQWADLAWTNFGDRRPRLAQAPARRRRQAAPRRPRSRHAAEPSPGVFRCAGVASTICARVLAQRPSCPTSCPRRLRPTGVADRRGDPRTPRPPGAPTPPRPPTSRCACRSASPSTPT